jgi:pimeloyl-ACP methyl ester carboxylesterase
MDIAFAELSATGHRRALKLEYRWINPERADAPVFVFLHEGLGSVAMWKDWPQTLCDALGVRGIVYSRPGYGRSTPRAPDEHWPVSYLADHARDVLPAFLDAIQFSDADRARMWLIGHSDGASIALLYAAAFPDKLASAVVIAPHLFVEQLSVDAIRETLAAYRNSDLRSRLAAYHDDVDSAFFGWNTIWLDPAFRSWDISGELAAIRCPLLAIQANNDGYATFLHIDVIQERVPHARAIRLDTGGHSPHVKTPAELNAAIVAFVHDTASDRRS